MKAEKYHQIFWSYLRQYRHTALMFLAYVAVFAFVFSLYRLEVEAVLYASSLCAALTSLTLAAHFFFYWKKHQERRMLLGQIEAIECRLPKAGTLMEADYQEIILALKGMYDAGLMSWENERRESTDYYTTWAHQIKSPIAAMRMMLQGEDTKEHRDLLAELFRVEQYVEMVLVYLRLGSETSDFVFRECALDDVIRQAVRKYAPLFVRRRIRFLYEPTGATALTDEKWLLFILEQLLSNAVKYTWEGAVAITAKGQQLRIADTGIGIAPEDVPRIFEKGFTGYNGRADKKATGLGLYLCRMAAERLSHKISVESQAGRGTTFTVDLRAAEVDLRE